MQDLQFLLYRPLYWFGQGTQPTLNKSLSLAYPPTFSGRTVTIKLKHYMWSNGTPVTAQNVMFWLNMELAMPADYGLYTGFPGNVSGMKAVSSTELTMTMDKAYSPTWFLYNELSQVTPMPAAWDRTAVRPEQLRHDSQRLRRGVRVPERSGERLQHVRRLAAVEHRGRAMEAERVQHRRACHVRAEQVLLRADKAEAGRVQGGALHHRSRGV